MRSLEITIRRALKMWWSFVWRAWVLTMPLAVVALPVMHWLMPIPKPGEPPVNPVQVPHFFAKFFILWLFLMLGMAFMQALAMRWALKTKWSDFKLIATPSDPEQGQ